MSTYMIYACGSLMKSHKQYFSWRLSYLFSKFLSDMMQTQTALYAAYILIGGNSNKET